MHILYKTNNNEQISNLVDKCNSSMVMDEKIFEGCKGDSDTNWNIVFSF
jgi:hypothetical protein